jgi:cysteine desulfurase/selenocysteine lyase
MKRLTLKETDIVQLWRADFPILTSEIRGKPLIYLDNAATTQKPHAVIEVEANYYKTLNANVHRGVHRLSQEATLAYEAARVDVAEFINAAHSSEVVFVRGTTEAINLVAQSFARPQLQAGDEIIVSLMEHHSNIVPWQILCKRDLGLRVVREAFNFTHETRRSDARIECPGYD